MPKKGKRIWPFLPMALLLFGCATAYGPMGIRGGYWDNRIASDYYQVGFSGNAFTSPNVVQAYAIRHAAEITLNAGYSYFVIAGENDTSSVSQFQTQGYYQGQTNYYGNSAYSTGTYTPGQTYTISRPNTSFIIRCFHENPGSGFNAYDVLGIDSSQGSSHVSKEAAAPITQPISLGIPSWVDTPGWPLKQP